MSIITYAEKPTQVKFMDDEGSRQYGIAYHDEIICACCGAIFELAEANENGPVEELVWIDFRDAIGEE